MHKIILSLAAALTLLHSGCADRAPAPPPVLHGTATYPTSPALPEGTVLRVELDNVTEPDRLGLMVGAVTVPASASGATSFAIPYDPNEIRPRRKFELNARVVGAQRILFITSHPVRVLTNGNPKDNVAITLIPPP